MVIIGGSFFSTSSGIRFLRIYALFKFSLNDLISLARPKNIPINKHYFLDISFKKNDANKYFLSILIFFISFIGKSSVIPVSIKPGATQFTVIFLLATSLDQDLTKATCPAFDAA